ncbi:orexin receptor type [Elysia marginata]|uniref:Orexin receptor type n=1 Tax=Elysia marginata TaxID=1093978 RepID=A0AAV4J088_9GAST|nr:orexin receptor type [Elysia marginata]
MLGDNSTVPSSRDLGNASTTPDYSHCKYFMESPEGIQCYTSDEHMLEEIFAYLTLTPLEWVISCVYVLVFVTGVSGNFLVCYAVWRNKYLRTITNCFLTNLAVADFLTIVFCLPPSFAQTIFETWFLGRALCKTIIYLQCHPQYHPHYPHHQQQHHHRYRKLH